MWSLSPTEAQVLTGLSDSAIAALLADDGPNRVICEVPEGARVYLVKRGPAYGFALDGYESGDTDAIRTLQRLHRELHLRLHQEHRRQLLLRRRQYARRRHETPWWLAA